MTAPITKCTICDSPEGFVVFENINLCLLCEDNMFNAMRRLRRRRAEDTREIERLSRTMADAKRLGGKR